MAAVLKTVRGESPSGVRIPLPPLSWTAHPAWLRVAGLVLLLLSVQLRANDGRDFDDLVAALGDPDPRVSDTARRRLLVAGPSALLRVQAAAESAVNRLEAARYRIDGLVRELDADEWETREDAQRSLIDAGYDALPALRVAAASGMPEQRARAQVAIEAIESGRTPGLDLLRMLALALGDQPDEASVPVLMGMASFLPRGSPAIESLEEVGGPAAVEALRALAEEADTDRRWSARAALLALGETPPGRLGDFLEDRPSLPVLLRVTHALDLCEADDVESLALRARSLDIALDVPRLERLLIQSMEAEVVTKLAVAALGSCDEGDRPFLASLFRARTRESVAVFRAVLDGADDADRAVLVEGAARLLGDDARTLVEPLLTSPVHPVRAAAVRAMHVILGREPGPFLDALGNAATAEASFIPALVRCQRADELRLIPDRWGRYSEAELDLLLKAATPLIEVTPRIDGYSDAVKFSSTMSSTRGAAVLVANRRLLADPLPGAPGDPSVDRLREIRALPIDGRVEALRAALQDLALVHRALAWCVVLDVDGLEADVLPYLAESSAVGTEMRDKEMARLYLSPRKSERLLERVRALALGRSPGEAATLWVEWEGRAAVESLLERVRATPELPLGVLRALAEAPLMPEDADSLLPWAEHEWSRGSDDGANWLAALARTGSPEAARVVGETLSCYRKLHLASQAACEALLRNPGTRPLAVRLAACSLSRMPGVDAKTWALAMEASPCSEGARALVGMMDGGDKELITMAARALVRCDPLRARAEAAARRGSRHARRRLAALWLELALDGRATGAALEVLSCHDRMVRGFALLGIVLYGGPHEMRAVVPLLCDPSPAVHVGSWMVLQVISAGGPDSMKNDLFIPREAREAWEEWLESHASSTRARLLADALASAGSGEGIEARIRACSEGPWHLAAAAASGDGPWRGTWSFASNDWLDLAARWRAALRAAEHR